MIGFPDQQGEPVEQAGQPELEEAVQIQADPRLPDQAGQYRVAARREHPPEFPVLRAHPFRAGHAGVLLGVHHARALPAYEAALRDYVAQGQKLPPGALRGFLPRTRCDIWLRNGSTRLMTRWPLRRLVAGILARADAIELPDYRPVTRSAAR